MGNNEDTLNRKQSRFVEEYLLDPRHNGKNAAIKAGYSCKRAAQQAVNLLALEPIKKRIAEEEKQVSLRNKITQEYFIIKLKGIVEETTSKNSDKVSALTLLARVTGHIKENTPENKTMVVVNTVGSTEVEAKPIIETPKS